MWSQISLIDFSTVVCFVAYTISPLFSKSDAPSTFIAAEKASPYNPPKANMELRAPPDVER